MNNLTLGRPKESGPILSICIPTYNRAERLENLFRNLLPILNRHADAIEIHVSNNSSTDNTQAIIDKWVIALSLEVVVQPENIGGTRNIVEVTKNAKGRWVIIIGDDDEFVPENFSILLNVLHSSDPQEWILVGIGNNQGNEYLLGNLKSGQYSAPMMRWIFLSRGISRFGFIAMHVIPRHLLPAYWALLSEPIDAWNSWPHLAFFLRHVLDEGRTRILRFPVVISRAHADSGFWQIGDWVCLVLRKLNVILEFKTVKRPLRIYKRLQILREILNLSVIKDLLFWRIVDPGEFSRRANREVRLTLANHLGSFSPCYIYLVAIEIFSFIPHKCLCNALKMLGRDKGIYNYKMRREKYLGADGTSRGQ